MANEKRLIDYQKAREIVLNELKGKITTVTAVMLATKMKYATVDAVEVVRCKDCRFCRTFFPEKQIGKEARQVWYCDLYRCNRKTDEYCSDGERREEV